VTGDLPGLRAAPAAADGISPRFAELLAAYGASPAELNTARDLTIEITPVPSAALPPRPRAHRWDLARLAGADPDVLAALPSARFRYQTLGGILLISAGLTTVAAVLAGAQAGITPVVSWLGGLLFGGLVLFTERLLVQAYPRRARTTAFRRSLAVKLNVAQAFFWAMVVSTPINLAIFAPQIDQRIAGQGAHTGLLARLDALVMISNENPSVRLASAALQVLLASIMVLPTVVVAIQWRARPTSYDLVLEVKERYAMRRAEMKEIRQVTTVPEPVTTEEAAAVRTELAEVTKRLTTLEARMTEENAEVLASVIDLESRRNRKAG